MLYYNNVKFHYAGATPDWTRADVIKARIKDSKKFAVDVLDVLGPNYMSKANVHAWIHEKPKGVLKWIRPPYENTYIELQYGKQFGQGVDAIGLVIEYRDGELTFHTVSLAPEDGTHYMQFMGFVTKINLYREWVLSDYIAMCGGDISVATERLAKTQNNFGYNPHVMEGQIIGLRDLTKDGVNAVRRHVAMALEVLIYMNSKGIGTNTHEPPYKLNKKRVKKGAVPYDEYKTLRIIKKGEPKDIINNRWGRKTPFCVRSGRETDVRGHYSIYTKEKPLFGNPKNVGPIWISPHVRNKGTKGKITKDYEISPGIVT